MAHLRRLVLLLIVAVMLTSSCSTFCCNKERARIEADIRMATEKKEDAEAAQKDAYLRLAWADRNNLAQDFPSQHEAATQRLKSADQAYDNLKYATARTLYREISTILSDDFQKKVLELRKARTAASNALAAALDAGGRSVASKRFESARTMFLKAEALKANSDLENAIPAYWKTAAAAENVKEYAEVNRLRSDIAKYGYAQYADTLYTIAENKLAEEEVLWNRGTTEDYKAGTVILREAKEYYANVLAEGNRIHLQGLSLDERDRALAARDAALAWRADVNAPDEFEKAAVLFADAERYHEGAEYEKAMPRYKDAAAAYEVARAAAEAREPDAAIAIAGAEQRLAGGTERAAELGLEENIFLVEAGQHLERAKALYADRFFGDAIFEANEVANYVQLSDNYVAEEAAIREKVAMETMVRDKAQADGAFQCARNRLAWAEQNNLKADYPVEYRNAVAAMKSAEMAYDNEKYVPARMLAEEVCAILSDEFMAKVMAAREKAAAAAAAPAPAPAPVPAPAPAPTPAPAPQPAPAPAGEAPVYDIAAAAAAADAIGDANRRMAWARQMEIGKDYPFEFRNAETSLAAAELAYSEQKYVPAKALAEDVSRILSDDFMARVVAEREQKAREKAEAVPAPEPAPVPVEVPQPVAEVPVAQPDPAIPQAEAQPASPASAPVPDRPAPEPETHSVQVPLLPAPRVALTASPERFSPDDDGINDMLRFELQAFSEAGIVEWKLEVFESPVMDSDSPDTPVARIFKAWSGKGAPPASIMWNGLSSRQELVESGTDYIAILTCTDTQGRQASAETTITIDILVIRDGDRLVLKVPAIVFRANHADFIGLPQEVRDRNSQVIARVIQILSRFPEYQVLIEGHANNVGKMLGYSPARIQQEELKEVQPLSLARAKKIRDMLVEQGIRPDRLSVAGMGSSRPLYSFTDVDNRWKNRRVEFILKK